VRLTVLLPATLRIGRRSAVVGERAVEGQGLAEGLVEPWPAMTGAVRVALPPVLPMTPSLMTLAAETLAVLGIERPPVTRALGDAVGAVANGVRSHRR
jgi:hypothetical protein